MKRFFKNSKGFTLVELLIVIAIIGILSTLITANFIGVRQRSRDATRKSNLRQIQSALELYRSDQGSYPTSIPNCTTSLMSPDCTSTTYMQKVPTDPGTSVYYTYSSDGTTYTLIACLENLNDSDKDAKNTFPCTGTSNWSFTLKNP
ncbi:MAG TPA: prepilin-type N-terminal cleavage/methylation domain-containing protein [Patescibacteria group bacterium]|nr:prepilin-type N-terminal cleavage/methylation domain-containing protein [Patescibacteria group bacterium]